MATLVINKMYANGLPLTEEQLDAAFESITTLINSTGLDGSNITDGTIGASELATNSVTTDKLANSAVTTSKIQDSQVTLNKLDPGIPNMLVPIGGILIWGGITPPPRFMFCNGAPLKKSDYDPLWKAISNNGNNPYWGESGDNFYLPDFSGVFLRGVNGSYHGAGNNVDHDGRTSRNGGASSGLGSFQDSAFKNHNHGVRSTAMNTPKSGDNNVFDTANNTGGGSSYPYITTSEGQSSWETRPKNIAVNYIIRVI